MIYSIEAGPLVMGDFDGDGIPDVAIGQPSTRRVAVLLTRKGGSAWTANRISARRQWTLHIDRGG